MHVSNLICHKTRQFSEITGHFDFFPPKQPFSTTVQYLPRARLHEARKISTDIQIGPLNLSHFTYRKAMKVSPFQWLKSSVRHTTFHEAALILAFSTV